MLYALIRENIVTGIADLSESDIQILSHNYPTIMDITNLTPQPQIGWVFDGVDIVGASPSMKITKLGMRQRFTFSELILLTKASNPTDSSFNPAVQVLMENLQIATFVDLLRPDTKGGINLLVSLGLISSARASTILNTPPRSDEVYIP